MCALLGEDVDIFSSGLFCLWLAVCVCGCVGYLWSALFCAKAETKELCVRVCLSVFSLQSVG